MAEEMSSLYKNDTWKLTELPKERRQLAINGYMQRNRDLLKMILYAIK